MSATLPSSSAVSDPAVPERSSRAIGLLVRAVILENLRRREFYVVLIIMALYLLGAIIARLTGIQNEATGSLVLNLGLTIASLSAHALVLLSAARQIPDELERRTIYPLLAKPLGRGQLLIGKWAASWLSGVATLFLLFPFAMMPIAQAGNTSGGLLFQALLLQVLSLAALGALAILGSLFFPTAVNIVVVGLLAAGGGSVVRLIRAYFSAGTLDQAVRWFTGYLPDFSRLDLILAYTSGGGAVSFPDLAVRFAHGGVFVIFPLALAVFLLRRRSL